MIFKKERIKKKKVLINDVDCLFIYFFFLYLFICLLLLFLSFKQ